MNLTKIPVVERKIIREGFYMNNQEYDQLINILDSLMPHLDKEGKKIARDFILTVTEPEE